jgi:hypothetical protein
MNATIEEEAPIRPFNALAAYQEARDENRTLWDALTRSLALIDSNADRLERRGEDVAHLRAFSRNIRARVLG